MLFCLKFSQKNEYLLDNNTKGVIIKYITFITTTQSIVKSPKFEKKGGEIEKKVVIRKNMNF
jgi:hypothetical protein